MQGFRGTPAFHFTLNHHNAGQTFYEGPNDIHSVGRNASNTKPAKFIVFFIKDQGAPVLVPVKPHGGGFCFAQVQ
jgi:hypothetical protein